MATNFGTKLTITWPRERYLRAVCTYPFIFEIGLFDDVVKISLLPTPVAMATNFETKLTTTRLP